VIDRQTADRFFPSQDPIGHEIAMYKGWAKIVGVVSAIRSTTLEEASRPVIYYSLAQVPFFAQSAAVVRSTVPAASLIRQAVNAASPSAPVFDVRTLEDRIDESLGIRRVVATLLAIFGAISLLLAAIGIYGVVAQVIGERTQEIGVRMALGARPAQILRHFLQQGLRSGIFGLALGFAGAAFAQKWVSGMLYQVHSFDTVTYAASGGILLALLAVAVWWPARRASRIDPNSALRYE
jgi:putative ABC transport system permease protein